MPSDPVTNKAIHSPSLETLINLFFFAACTNPHTYKLGITSIPSTPAMTNFRKEGKRYTPDIASPSFYVLSYFARPTLLSL